MIEKLDMINILRTAYRLRQVDVDHPVVVDVDRLQAGNVVRRRRRPVDELEHPVVPIHLKEHHIS